MSAAYRRVVIVGLGLLGGSVALALKRRKLAKRVVAIGRDLGRLRPALKARMVDEISVSYEAAKEADLIILCGPFQHFETQLKALSKIAPAGCLVTDVGSVKGAAVARWHRAAGPLHFVASHPMAGGEKTGWEHSNADLFKGAACLMTPLPQTQRKAALKVAELWQALGADLALMTPKEHDRLVGRVSHLPHAVAFALCAALEREGKAKDFLFAGRGFWDSSRIGASDPALWAEIFAANRSGVAQGIRRVAKELTRLAAVIDKAQAAPIRRALAPAASFRSALESLRPRP